MAGVEPTGSWRKREDHVQERIDRSASRMQKKKQYGVKKEDGRFWRGIDSKLEFRKASRSDSSSEGLLLDG